MIANKPKLFSYVVARDFGFAPNPFFGYCTLATCKPEIRKAARIGDWIIGTSSKGSHKKNNCLVYFMKVTEILTFDQYWSDSRFERKKPNFQSTEKYAYGDNIYHEKNGIWEQEISHHRKNAKNTKNLKRDIGGKNVLISNNFGYFGKNPLDCIPQELLNPNKLLNSNKISATQQIELKNIKKYKKLFGIVKSGPGHKCKFHQCIVDLTIEWLGGLSTGKIKNPAKWERKYNGN